MKNKSMFASAIALMVVVGVAGPSAGQRPERPVVVSADGSVAWFATGKPDSSADAALILADPGRGQIMILVMNSGETLLLELIDADEGRIHLNGKQAAWWLRDADGHVIGGGFEILADSRAFNVLVHALVDAPPPQEAAFPLVPWVGALWIADLFWCINQCQCCEEYYANGGSPQNEPSCCSNCFNELLCDSWPF